MANAVGVPDAREFGEQLASLSENFSDKRRFARADIADRSHVVARARGKKPLDALKLDGNSAPLEQAEHVSPAPSRRQGADGHAIRHKRRIGAVIEQELKNLDRVVAQGRLV